jgi:hypothetical protein
MWIKNLRWLPLLDIFDIGTLLKNILELFFSEATEPNLAGMFLYQMSDFSITLKFKKAATTVQRFNTGRLYRKMHKYIFLRN